MEASQANQQDGEHAVEEHVVQGHSGLDPLTRDEQQPQEAGHSSAPPPDAQSGVGASGIPANPGAQGGQDAQPGVGDQAAAQEGDQAA